jgi:hypothetical protein
VRLTRRRVVELGLLGLGMLVRSRPAFGAARHPLLSDVSVAGTGRPFAADRELLATVSPFGARKAAKLRFRLARPAVISLDVLQTGQGVASERPVTSGQTGVSSRTLRLGSGAHALDWAPDPTLPPRTYILRLTAQEALRKHVQQATVRVLGVDAGFSTGSVRQGGTAGLVVRTDAKRLKLQLLRCGPETEQTYANDELKGVAVTDPVDVDWSRRQNAPAALYVPFSGDWPSGIYTARLDADDGRVGFAPIVVTPAAPTSRVAVVVPVTTWQAYNFYDADGDGWGDTWYARWRTRDIDLRRPLARRGVPYRFRSYELGFYHWLAARGVQVDYYSDQDVETFGGPDALRAAYDLLVFPGHTEYVTTELYDVVTGYRDLGGNLIFLSANNFFRRVDRTAHGVHLVDEWRKLSRPESALCGIQYVAGDRGERHGPYTVVGADAAPWAFEGTGLANGSQFGLYGIEIDARAPSSPPGTTVLATIPDLFGAGRSAEMAYYEHASGARVFSGGALNFGGQILLWPETARLLENVWLRCGGTLASAPAAAPA